MPAVRTLTVRVALVGGLVAIVLVASIAPLAAAAIRQSVVDQEVRKVSAQVQRLLSPSFAQEEFRAGLKPDTRELMDELSSDPRNRNVLRVRLWSRDGILLYSNDSTDDEKYGRPFSADTMYLSVEGYLRFLVFRERKEWAISEVQTESASPLPAGPGALIADDAGFGVARLFMPVNLDGSAAPAGALEVFYDFRPLERKLASTRRTVWTTIPGGILALYCAMLMVVQRTPDVLFRRRDGSHPAHSGVFRTLARVVDARDAETADHSGRVALHAVAMARRLRLPAETIEELKIAAALHDIGKISVPDAVLGKPGPLTPEEWEVVRQHAAVGSRILQTAPLSDTIKRAVRHVHERWDGTGYPDRLAGEQIPLFARILAVADTFEAMTSDRPYRRALSAEDALAELEREQGIQFDPHLVNVFCEWAKIRRRTA